MHCQMGHGAEWQNWHKGSQQQQKQAAYSMSSPSVHLCRVKGMKASEKQQAPMCAPVGKLSALWRALPLSASACFPNRGKKKPPCTPQAQQWMAEQQMQGPGRTAGLPPRSGQPACSPAPCHPLGGTWPAAVWCGRRLHLCVCVYL